MTLNVFSLLLLSFCFSLPSSVFATASKFDKAIKIQDDCGATLLTQWEVDFKAKTLNFIRKNKFPDYYCEPLPPGNVSQAQISFLNEKKEILWTRRIQLSRISNFDRPAGKSGDLKGGWAEKDKAVIQLKIPDNDFSNQLHSIQIQTEDDLKLGPALLK